MDERDFAELISVFLKGGESDAVANVSQNEKSDSITTRMSSSEAEIRKSIIEALAEKIKGSQDKNSITEERVDSAGAPETEKIVIDDIAQDTENILLKSTAEPTVIENAEKPERANTETDVSVTDELITEEEVASLLISEEPGETMPLQRILHRFLSLDGIVAAILVTRDGFMIDYVSSIELELDMISAIVATGFGTLDRIGHELDRGNLQIAMLEYVNGPVVLSPLVHDVVLVIMASQRATLGRIRWEIKKRASELIINL